MANALDINFIKKFTGYKNYRDITNLAPTDLISGSQNVFITDGVKIDVRGGSSFLGTEGTIGVNTNPSWTLAHRIHSDYSKFVNNQGVTMPFRVFYSGTSAQGDVLETWLPVYVAGVAQSAKKWYQVNATAPLSPILSKHEWYWAEWYDSLNGDNRIVFTYGSSTVQSYTGGFAPIVSKTGTTLVTNGTWLSKGFINAPEGINKIVVNVSGVPTEMALTSGNFSTNTITVASTMGVSVDDLAFQSFNADTIDLQAVPTGFVADVCSTINNQVYYLDWRQRNGLVSWDRNRVFFLSDVVYEGTSGLNDAVFTGTFTGTQTDTYKVVIDSINPASQAQTFMGTGINDGYFTTSGYTGTGLNTYRLVFVADFSFAFSGTPSIVPNPGDILVGGTSGATGRVAFLDSGGQDPVLVLLTTQGFVPGETVTGTQGSYGTIATASPTDWFQIFKNGTPLVPTGYTSFIAYELNPVLNPQTISFVDSLSITFQNGTGHTVGDAFQLVINSGSPDTYAWSLNGTTVASNVPVSLSPTLLSNGVDVNFIKTTGHAIGDNWTMIAYPTINRGWRQVYYTTPARLPGEGFRFQLDSNGWALQPQQSSMYVNGQAGEYYDITLKLSSNLQSQTISVERLKTEPQKKALYPYLMTSEPNYLSIVSTEKTWDILGQQKFLQLPQSKTFSDQVRVDFQNANWLNGRQTYFDRKQWFTIPEQNQIFVYDDFMKYWHPPQSFGRKVSSVIVIDGQICGHSYERNETYQLFTNDLNDLGIYPISTRIAISYYDFNKRFNKKTMTAVAFDGYMYGKPDVTWTVNYGIGGCEGMETGTIKPILCIPTDQASLGKSPLGFHGLGNSPTGIIPHFAYGSTFDSNNYYLRNIELSCNSLEQRWSITSMGTDVKYNLTSNADIFNP